MTIVFFLFQKGSRYEKRILSKSNYVNKKCEILITLIEFNLKKKINF